MINIKYSILLNFKMFSDFSLKDPSLEIIDIDLENEDLDHFDIIKRVLDSYSLIEIIEIFNIQLNEVIKLLK